MTCFRDSLFAGKVAFVAGGTSGINLGIATRLAELGASVCVAGRDPDKAARAARDVGGPAPAIGLSCDVRDFPSIDAALATTADRFGPIDFIVSGAAGNFVAPALGMSANGFRTVIDIDLNGTFNVFRAAFDKLNRPGAALIAISAGQAVNPTPLQAHACAAKAGINQLVRVLAMEWGHEGVRVNGISPGPIAGTEGMARLAPTAEAEQALTSKIALGRYGLIGEVADAATFLLSDAARYVTGTILDCDGGTQLGDARQRSPEEGIV